MAARIIDRPYGKHCIGEERRGVCVSQRSGIKPEPEKSQTDVQGLGYPGGEHSQAECQQQVSERLRQVTILVIVINRPKNDGYHDGANQGQLLHA